MIVLLTWGEYEDYSIQGARDIPDGEWAVLGDLWHEELRARIQLEDKLRRFRDAREQLEILEATEEFEYADSRIAEVEADLESTKGRIEKLGGRILAYPKVFLAELTNPTTQWGIHEFDRNYVRTT